MNHKDLPPLNALVAFEASVRHGSFKLASAELNVTPGAISQQIRKLEDWLGFLLFQRSIRHLQVTERGVDYYSRITPALEDIKRHSQACVENASRRVCLSLGTALAAKWLTPRIGDFMSRNSDIDVHINATNKTVEFHRESVDLAIRYFDGNDTALVSEFVFRDEIRLLCTPDYRDRQQLFSTEDLAHASLIHSGFYLSWSDWLTRFSQLDDRTKAKIPGIYFDQPLLAIEAAKQSQGVVLSNLLLTEGELQRGELIEPFPIRQPLHKGYYLIYPRKANLNSGAKRLKEWLITQADGVSS